MLDKAGNPKRLSASFLSLFPIMNKSIWLLRLLSRRGKLSKQEILTAWQDEDLRGRSMAASTFYDNRRYLEERYGIRLVCKDGCYSLEHADAEQNPVLRQLIGGEGDAETLSADSALLGSHWMPLLLDAMQRGLCLRMEYAPLDKAAYETDFAPYCLYPFRGCAYTVGRSDRHGETRTFAVDRIRSLVLLPTRFRRPASFSVKEYFRHSFGAYGGADVHPERVELEACPRLAAYLRQRPLHASQHELSEETTSLSADCPARFEVQVAITDDFVRELLSHGADLRVVSPSHLCSLLREKAQAVAELYS